MTYQYRLQFIKSTKGLKMKAKLFCSVIFGTSLLFGGGSYKVKPANNKLYQNECASCHFGYQPGLLPKKSWKKLMKAKSLENHFGVDASLDEADRVKILKYLEANSAETQKNSSKVSRKFLKSLVGKAPLKITDIPYFKKEHREIPKRLIVQKEVKSLANCKACHTTADKGYFGEKGIKIPNYGKWDD